VHPERQWFPARARYGPARWQSYSDIRSGMQHVKTRLVKMKRSR
jgi:hypothetical protein